MSEAIDKLIQWGVTKDPVTCGRTLRGTIILECSEPVTWMGWPAGREAAKERIAAALAERVAELTTPDRIDRRAAEDSVPIGDGEHLARVALAAPGSTQTSADGEPGSVDTETADVTGAKNGA